MQRKGSLQSKLRQSVLSTTGLSLLLLALALILIAWLGRTALHLANVKAPAVLQSERLLRGVQASQEYLLNWAMTGEQRERLNRRKVWDETVIPSLEELLSNNKSWTAEERRKLLEVRDKIYELEALQWWVEDCARSAGNRPAVGLYHQEIQGSFEGLLADLSALLHWQASVPESDVRRELILAFSNLRDYSSAANAAFADFLLSHDQDTLVKCDDHLDEAKLEWAALREDPGNFPDRGHEIAARIEANFAALRTHLAEARFLHQSGKRNYAKDLIRNEIGPIVSVVKSNLIELDRRELSSLTSGGGTVESLTWLAMIGLPLFMVATAFVAVSNARQFHSEIVLPIHKLVDVAESINVGEYTKRVDIRSDDEIGLLSTSFNSMADSFMEITKVATAVARGDFSQRLEVSDDRDLLRNAINAMNSKLVEIKDQAQRIAHGNYSMDFSPMSERDELGHALRLMTINLRESTTRLASSEAYSSAVIRTAQDGIITFGEDRIIQGFNPAAERMFGYQAEEIVNLNLAYLITPEDNEHHLSSPGSERGEGRELKARKKDGSVFPILFSIGKARVDDKHLFTAIVRDLTRETQAREELDRSLKEQEEQNRFKSQLALIYDSSQGITDPKLLCKTILSQLAVQLELEQALFYCVEEEDGSDDILRLYASYGLQVPEDLPQNFRIEEGLVGECAHQKETIVISPVPEGYLSIASGLGGRPPRELMLLPILFERHLLGVMELATFKEFSLAQREYIEQVILNIGAILKSVMEQRRTQELLLVTQEQSEGLRVQQEELRVSNEELKRQTDQLQTSEEELRVQQAELAEANTQLKASARNLKERNELLNSQNAELEKAREAIRLKAEELENASRYKSEFLANMSHELRTPLNSILVLANLLRENKQKNLDAKQEKFAGVIYQSGNDLLTLINEILDLSKIEAGMLELECADVPIVDITRDIDNLFREVSLSKQLSFAIEVAKNCPDTIHVDKLRLEQVIKNLISNAFKFTSEGGSVDLTIRPVSGHSGLRTDSLRNADSILTFAVRDTGIGIPEEKQDAVFESFQQADGSTSRKYGGTGLGLSISRELVNRMGGEIHLKSKENEGATFTIYLPVEQPVASVNGNGAGSASQADLPQPAKNGTAPPSHANGSPSARNGSVPKVPDDRDTIISNDRTVLIVEDNPDFASAALERARAGGLKGLVATSGPEGLKLAHRFRVDAILLDIELPAMSGWEVLETLKTDAQLAQIPVHTMSILEVKDRALNMGAVAHHLKPISTESLANLFDGIRTPTSCSQSVKTVLIVEDDENQNFAIRELLQGRGFATASAFSGQEAIRRLTESPVELVVLDLGLPDISGLDLLDQIRTNQSSDRLPIIVLTGREMAKEEVARIEGHQGTIILKTQNSGQRLLDETALCLRKLEEEGQVSKPKRRWTTNSHNVLEGKTVLIVDDDERNTTALSSLLEEHLMRVLVGRTGMEGLDMLDKHPETDLVLMDVMMPEMDGYEAIRNIRKQPRFDNLPVIAVTAKAMKGDREDSLEAGASEYISKPVDTKKLLTLLSVWLYR